MQWQQMVSLAIVGVAGALLIWGRFRRRKFSFARETHCGCSAAAELPTQSSILFHARKGELPQIVVKIK